ncbi:hypothetical protein L345_10182, partial [Ophiophagus hannah]
MFNIVFTALAGKYHSG